MTPPRLFAPDGRVTDDAQSLSLRIEQFMADLVRDAGDCDLHDLAALIHSHVDTPINRAILMRRRAEKTKDAPVALPERCRVPAEMYGVESAISMMRDYAEQGTGYFPKGLSSMVKVCAGLAKVSLFASCAWDVTDEEKNIAEAAARRTVETFLAVAERFKTETQMACPPTEKDSE